MESINTFILVVRKNDLVKDLQEADLNIISQVGTAAITPGPITQANVAYSGIVMYIGLEGETALLKNRYGAEGKVSK